MPLPKSESRKQLDELERQQQAESMPTVKQYGMESAGDVKPPKSRHEAKVEEIMRSLKTTEEHKAFQAYRKRGIK